ncbi:MAG: winged helix-turn-helix transcriptional regulator [Thermoprotei archaeon]
MKECPVTRAWKIIGRPWRLVIIDRLLAKPRTFNELIESMPGISTRTLTKALSELKRLGIIEKVYDGKRHYYALTDAGKDLSNVVKNVREWSEKWLLPKEQKTVI